jgi:hypothetical protein
VTAAYICLLRFRCLASNVVSLFRGRYPVMGLHATVHWVSLAVSPGVKRQECVSDRSPLSNVEIENGGARQLEVCKDMDVMYAFFLAVRIFYLVSCEVIEPRTRLYDVRTQETIS